MSDPTPGRAKFGAALSATSFGTSLAVVICWIVHIQFEVEVPPEVAIAVAGIFTGCINALAVLLTPHQIGRPVLGDPPSTTH